MYYFILKFFKIYSNFQQNYLFKYLFNDFFNFFICLKQYFLIMANGKGRGNAKGETYYDIGSFNDDPEQPD